MANVKPTSKKFSPLDPDVNSIPVGDSLPPGKFSDGAQFFHKDNSILYVYADGGWQATTGAGGVVDEFIALSDTPGSYVGSGELWVTVKADASGVEFVSPASATSRLAVMTGATAGAAGTKGMVPPPAAGFQGRFLRGDASWQNVVTSEVEVTRGFGPPTGLPSSTNDLYVDLNSSSIWYSTGSLWEKISVPNVADVYATMPAGYPANPSSPTPAEAQAYAASLGLIGPTIVSYAGGGSTTDPAFAWFIDSVGSAVCIRDLTAQKGDTGAAGPPGPAGVVWKGNWSSSTSYVANDAVLYQGTSWRALQSHTNQTPVAGAYWAVLAQKGADGGLSDGDKGDISVTSSGSVWTVDANTVTYSKMQDVSAASRLLGRGSTGAGDPQEISLGTGLTMTGTTVSVNGTIPDNDYGDIQVTGGVWKVDDDADIQLRSALLGSTSGGGAGLHSAQANLLEVRSGAAPNKLAVYNAYQSPTNHERILIGWSGNIGCIATEKGSSGGAARSISIATDGTERINVGANGFIRFNQAYTFPNTVGTLGQVLGVGTGSVLEWFTPSGSQPSVSNPKMVTSTPHGFTAASIGYPLFAATTYVDTDPEQWPTGIFDEYINSTSFRYATEGSSLDIASSLFEVGYSIDAGGRFVFWDYSVQIYKAEKPVDSDPRLGPLLMVNYLESGKFNCTVLGLGPSSW
jgi:hypothetical protein